MREGGEDRTKVEQDPIGRLAGDALENLCGPTVTASFHHASAVQAIVDLIEDGDGGEVLMESGQQAVDYQRRDRSGAVAMNTDGVARIVRAWGKRMIGQHHLQRGD